MRATCLWICQWSSPILLQTSFCLDPSSRNIGALIWLQRTVHLQCLQADEAGDRETIDDVLLTGHGLSLPPAGRPVSAVPWSTLSPPGASYTVGATGPLLIRARGQRRGSLLVHVHSPPPPLPVPLRPGPAALSEPRAATGTLHIQAPSSGSFDTKGTLTKSRSGEYQTKHTGL